MDTTDPEITFDQDGVCNHCRRADRLLSRYRWSDEASARALADVAAVVKRSGEGHEYDSVIGLSGGVDSSYTAVLAAKLGLRPLAVHFDNGWNSELAIENIQRVVEGCGFDLHTYVIDWREFRDLQRAFLRASVIDIEVLTDHAIVAAMYGLARDHRLRYVLSGDNIATEHGMPQSWVWPKLDWRNIKAIHARFGEAPLRTFPHLSTVRWAATELTGRGLQTVQLLNHTNYRRDAAAAELARDYGWREYGGKHHESTFTKFFQGAILPRKFGIDKRRVHLSDRMRNGELSRSEVLDHLVIPIYTADELRMEGDFVRKKLGFTEPEWDEIMAARPRSHWEFGTDRRYAAPFLFAVRAKRRLSMYRRRA